MSQQVELIQQNPMLRLRIGKVVLNIGVGKSGEALERAKRVLSELVGQTPCPRLAKQTIRDFGIHKGEPIGVIVTLRKNKAEEVLRKLLQTKNNVLTASSFDDFGNCSFGIREHIEIPGVRYNPEIGIFGMDVSVVVERPGYRVAHRVRARGKIGKKHRVSKAESIEFFKSRFGSEVT